MVLDFGVRIGGIALRWGKKTDPGFDPSGVFFYPSKLLSMAGVQDSQSFWSPSRVWVHVVEVHLGFFHSPLMLGLERLRVTTLSSCLARTPRMIFVGLALSRWSRPVFSTYR